MGATGAIYAVRRELLVSVPERRFWTMCIFRCTLRSRAASGFRARARAWDSPDLGGQREFARKVRTLSGNYQLLQLAPWLLSRENPLRFEFVSHKLLRLAVPFALAILLVASAVLRAPIFCRGAAACCS